MPGLEADLRRRVRGAVRFDAGSRAVVASGGSLYRQVPVGVVIPEDPDAVVEAVGVCRDHDVPVLPLGADTSLAGQSTNVAVVIDFTPRLNRVVELDPDAHRARVQPGVVLDHLRAAAEQHGLTFGPDPSTHAWCTLGGMIGNNACGVHSVTTGKTDDNVEELEILTYDGLRMRVGATTEDELSAIIGAGGRRGEIYGRLRAVRDRYAELVRARYPRIPRRVSGYNLDRLLPENGFHVARALVGSEGTCVTILDATLRLVPNPRARSLVVLGFPDIVSAADHVMQVLEHHPVGLEGIDGLLVDDMEAKGLHPAGVALFPPGQGWLLVELAGETRDEAAERARRLVEDLGSRDVTARAFADPALARRVWEVRESGPGAATFVPGRPETHEGWEDAAVAPERLGAYIREFRALLASYSYRGALYGHFGEGCVHTRIDFDLRTTAGIARFRSFLSDAADLVVGHGGSLSGEHGDGQSRAELLPRMFGSELVQAFREFKAVWDPGGRMNPHKIVDPYRADDNLRPGAPRLQVRTHFAFPDDGGSFADATRRCVGVGRCRRTEGGTMCPSFMVTREEKHTTRGRAHLLFEMLTGDLIGGGWRDRHVKEALDLCLACKGCKAECPVNVDIATYKSEFLSHYYRGRLRPRAAYALGLVPWTARLAAHAPRLANFVTHAPGLGAAAKLAAGVAPERRVPSFARRTLRDRLRSRPVAGAAGRPVLLWLDTWTNHFRPEVGEAAVRVLEAAGFRVIVPDRELCCGRPLYDFGMLPLAKRALRRVLTDLRPHLAAGVPVVGLEPSCVAVFRDELANLFPDDQDALRLTALSCTLGELLLREAPDFQLPTLRGRALAHGHCHHRAVMGFGDEEEVLRRMGLDVEVPDSGCCGMAGAFGFERGRRYEVSVKAGERVLLPAVRGAAADTLVVADGFSCREQIAQGCGRDALHLAQVIAMAL
ncbi:MAG TPA: FAD-binding and (Fe-S)-binding domain-containing protein [Acidimicrobiales bacterium]|nr:FAD-binding and (Fe-S)-binding domain-containing protein [Acidimicrobiales bacterium]